tara:strand:- start:272 stop:643 length:372 start_codon:yes stop_codon:yes gene_type:complete
MMPEGLVKISSALYDSILPLVRTQVQTQIKVRDLSKASVHVCPSEHNTWKEARNEIALAAKKPIRARMNAEIATASSDQHDAIRAKYEAEMNSAEYDVDNKTRSFNMELGIEYNFLDEAKADA